MWPYAARIHVITNRVFLLAGLRKFRRQMTIEEQLQKSVSMADVVAAAVQPDELDDIDKVRDDLQSAKQMLALELRNKEAIERENKRLAARLANLEVELEKEKAHRVTEVEIGHPVRTDEDEKVNTISDYGNDENAYVITNNVVRDFSQDCRDSITTKAVANRCRRIFENNSLI